MVLPVLIKLRETSSDIIDKQLRQLFVRLNDEAEELPVIVIDNVTKLLLEWERLEVFPSEILRFEDKYAVLQFVDFLGLSWDKLFIFLEHATEDDDVLRVEAEGEVIGDLLWHLDIEDGPDAQLGVVPLD